MDQLIDWTKKLEEGLKASGRDKLAMPTVLTSTVASTASADATLAAITASRSYRLAERVRRLRLRRG